MSKRFVVFFSKIHRQKCGFGLVATLALSLLNQHPLSAESAALSALEPAPGLTVDDKKLTWSGHGGPAQSYWLPSPAIQQGALLLYRNPHLPIFIAFKSTAIKKGLDRLQKEYMQAMSDYPQESQALCLFLQNVLKTMEPSIGSDQAIGLAYVSSKAEKKLLIFTLSSSFFHDFELPGCMAIEHQFLFSHGYYQDSLREILLRIAKVKPDEAKTWTSIWASDL